jgi:hypothetical protein
VTERCPNSGSPASPGGVRLGDLAGRPALAARPRSAQACCPVTCGAAARALSRPTASRPAPARTRLRLAGNGADRRSGRRRGALPRSSQLRAVGDCSFARNVCNAPASTPMRQLGEMRGRRRSRLGTAFGCGRAREQKRTRSCSVLSCPVQGAHVAELDGCSRDGAAAFGSVLLDVAGAVGRHQDPRWGTAPHRVETGAVFPVGVGSM